ncbi:MAG: hypothetical protein RIC56_05230 [Pseudomonadales bacterium]
MSTSTTARGTAVLLALAGALGVAAAARAESLPLDGGASYVIQADVVQVSPRYGWHEVSEPVRECVNVTRPVTARPLPGYGYRGGLRVARDYRDHDYDYAHGRRRDGSETAAGLVGGLIGGLIGNQFGGGRGRTALTVAGAMLGASVATDHVRRSRAYAAPDHGYAPARSAAVQRCTDSYRTRQVRGVHGYDVTYRYQGQNFTKRMDEHPGDTVAIRVAVEPG